MKNVAQLKCCWCNIKGDRLNPKNWKMRLGWNISDALQWAIGWIHIISYYINQIMKEFDRFVIMNGSSISEPSLSSKQLSEWWWWTWFTGSSYIWKLVFVQCLDWGLIIKKMRDVLISVIKGMKWWKRKNVCILMCNFDWC